jgi:hypothetical protein
MFFSGYVEEIFFFQRQFLCSNEIYELQETGISVVLRNGGCVVLYGVEWACLTCPPVMQAPPPLSLSVVPPHSPQHQS